MDKNEIVPFFSGKISVFHEKFVKYLKEREKSIEWQTFATDFELLMIVWDCVEIPGWSVDAGESKAIIGGKGKVGEVDITDECDENAIKIALETSSWKNSGYAAVKKCQQVIISKSKNETDAFNIVWVVAPKKYTYVHHVFADLTAEYLSKLIVTEIHSTLDVMDVDSIEEWIKKKPLVHDLHVLEAYVAKLFSNKSIPGQEFITEVAFQNYEKRKNKAQVVFAEESTVINDIKDLDGIARLDIVFEDEALTEKARSTYFRKLLEACNNKAQTQKLVLIAANGKPYTPIAIGSEKLLKNLSFWSEELWAIKFKGMGAWELLRGAETVLLYNRGSFFIDTKHENENFDKLANRMNLKAKDKRRKIFREVLKKLNAQGHGALMIVAEDAKVETEKLCKKFLKGTLVEGLDLSKASNRDLLDGFAYIDGAIMVDFNCICHGFGIILEEQPKVKGDLGRGSRFNSARNYVADKNKYAVIVSEDKERGIEIIDGNTLPAIK